MWLPAAPFGFRLGIIGVLPSDWPQPRSALDLRPGSDSHAGSIIFSYTIGIQSGPEFFKSLRRRGYRNSVFALGLNTGC